MRDMEDLSEFMRSHVSDAGRTHIGDRETCLSLACEPPDPPMHDHNWHTFCALMGG